MDIFKQNSATREDLGLLAVMDALVDDEQVTQRDLSRRTGLNLKKVNYCLHKLLEKGYIKFQNAVNNPDKRTYLYILTPVGLKAKSQLTYRFLKFTLGFYNQIEAKFEHCLDEMAQSGIRRIALYGVSEAARIALELVEKNGIEVVGIVDPVYRKKSFNGIEVLHYDDLAVLQWDSILITAIDELADVENQLRDWGLAENRIWRLP